MHSNWSTCFFTFLESVGSSLSLPTPPPTLGASACAFSSCNLFTAKPGHLSVNLAESPDFADYNYVHEFTVAADTNDHKFNGFKTT